MAPSSRPQHHLDLGHLPTLFPNQARSATSTAASSPIEPPATTGPRLPLESPSGLGSFSSIPTPRIGAGSPSLEHGGGSGGRLYPRRAREIKGSEGSSHHVWGPPTASGVSTPLRETIPESPGDDGTDVFPNLGTPTPDASQQSPNAKRLRAGTVPSKFPGGSVGGGLTSLNPPASKSSRPTPSSSPFRPGTASLLETGGSSQGTSNATHAALLLRLRAGSMPQRSSFLSSSSSPFGQSIFSSNWSSSRERGGTLTSIHSDPQESPTDLSYMKGDLADTDVKTLDYLGLVDSPQQMRSADSFSPEVFATNGRGVSTVKPVLANLAELSKNASRFRSYSVNATGKYATQEDDEQARGAYYSGTLTPSAEAAAAALAATQAQIHQHNLEVQAFANQASSSRPRARTAGVLDAPPPRLWRTFVPSPSRLDNGVDPSEMHLDESTEFEELSDALKSLQLQNGVLKFPESLTVAEHTRALWLGGIPPSTTPSSLKVIFEPFGTIESARVLTHKSCGFVNFGTVESAVRARNQLNGKEIFPGAGPIRISFAKAPSASDSPEVNGLTLSQSPDPFTQNNVMKQRDSAGAPEHLHGVYVNGITGVATPRLRDIKSDIMQIVKDFGARDEERIKLSASLDQAVRYDLYETEIPPVPEPSNSRAHDAPRLREIRKRIDNNSCTQMEIEDMAISMLPEIAELASDYLGNTVVQKLFEFCSEHVKEAMLQEIAPHMAEIGVHKNGTWAAQKIIEMARTPMQMGMIVDRLRPYAMALFLDQYGNYVMQCCLRFNAPWNSFIFEVMLSRLWEIAQGRFGARAMRACLESHHATKEQQRMLAAAITLYGVQLATNANGALLLTWFLDTCTFPNRRKAIAPRLIPHLVHLCTHKVAYLTVLKVINQRNEPEARDAILQAIFFSADDRILQDILSDQTCGATFIFKILTTPFFDESIRSEVVQNIRRVLLHIKAQPNQGYKRLMDEVGVSARGSGLGGREAIQSGREDMDFTTPDVNQSTLLSPGNMRQAGTFSQANEFPQTNGSYFNQIPGQMSFTPNAQQGRNGMVLSPGYSQPQMFSPTPGMSSPPSVTSQNHLQYLQTMQSRPRPQSLYNYPAPAVNGFFSPQGQSLIDAYRNSMGRNDRRQHQPFVMGSSQVMPQAGYGLPTGYNPMMSMGMATSPMWQQQYPGAYMMPQMQPQVMMNGVRGAERRDRR